jgi:hypothetical protein
MRSVRALAEADVEMACRRASSAQARMIKPRWSRLALGCSSARTDSEGGSPSLWIRLGQNSAGAAHSSAFSHRFDAMHRVGRGWD